jgi:voltage-gated potassium channel
VSRRRKARTAVLYVATLAREFRWTLLAAVALVLLGAVLYGITPHAALGGRKPLPVVALYGAWMALFAQPILSPPETWYLALLDAVYPLFGFVLVGEGIVRLSMLVMSKEQGEAKWMTVMASTYRNHVVLCGVGHLGFRTLAQLVAAGVEVVAIEKNTGARFMAEAKATGVPVLVRDMKDDAALVEAGVPHARCIIIATDDDMANLEVALDARRMNPGIRIVMRMFDQQIASKVRDAFSIDQAFSAAALAAPAVAAMAVGSGVLASYAIGDVTHVAAEVEIATGSPLAGRAVADVESEWRVLIGAQNGERPGAGAKLAAKDRVVVHGAADAAARFAANARGS